MNNSIRQNGCQEPTIATCEVTVRFGRLSADCINFGLCHVELMKETEIPLGSNWVKARMSRIGNHSTFLFEVDELPLGIISKHFSSEKFKVDEDFHLPTPICNALDVKEKKIPKGEYPILKSVFHFRIEIDLGDT